MAEDYPEPVDSNDLSPDEMAAARLRSRVYGAVLALVFLLAAVAPPPWSALAPLLLVIPFIYSIVTRRRRSASEPVGTRVESPPGSASSEIKEPYSYTPRDPKDPRRYKPIG